MTRNFATKLIPPLWLLLWLLVACAQNTPTSPATPINEDVAAPLVFTPPVLVPTFTPLSTPGPLPTFTPNVVQTVAATSTPVNFNETAVELRYNIPAIGLDRRLQAKVGGSIILVDEITLLAVEQVNQPGILLEIRQAVEGLELAPVPEGCDTCVWFRYDLPLTGVSEEGWLQDPILLASIENYMAINLGPHFPPDTVLGLRRSASPFAPAHSLALTANGRLWAWLATEGQISELSDEQAAVLSNLLPELPIATLDNQYLVECAGTPNETLWLNPTGEKKEVFITCPAYALPTTLLPLYLVLHELLTEKTADVALPQPPFGFPLDALLDYRRADGPRLTLYQDGTLQLQTADLTYTTTLTTTTPISLTGNLLASGILQPGLTTFFVTDTGTPTPAVPLSILLVRATDGVWDGQWENTADIPALLELDTLLNSLLALAQPQETATPTGTETAVTPTP